MKPEIINAYIKAFQEETDKIAKEPNDLVKGIMWFQSIDKLLQPIWQDGFDDGVKEGVAKEKEKCRITKSN